MLVECDGGEVWILVLRLRAGPRICGGVVISLTVTTWFLEIEGLDYTE